MSLRRRWPPFEQFSLLWAALTLLALQLAATFPGQLNADSTEQLREAISHEYFDWHPPVMALIWSWLLKLGGGPGCLLVLHQCLHWLGFGLIADGCDRAGSRGKAWLVLAAGAFPLFLFYDRVMQKDVAMASAFVAAAGIFVWFLLQARAVPLWAALLAGVCLAYGGLVRANAAFALGPLLCLLALGRWRTGFLSILMISALTVLSVVPLSDWINHRLIGAKQEYPIQSLQIFDLMGIAVHAKDPRVWGEDPPALSEVRDCYTPYWWDPVSPWGRCPQLRRKIGFSSSLDTTDPTSVDKTSRLWRNAILAHPLAYAAHRLKHFNSEIYFFVPAFQFRFSKSVTLDPPKGRSISQREIRFDYLKNNVFCWPVVWLTVGASALLMFGFVTEVPARLAIARLLIISALFYSCGYLLVGVATEERYHYWSVMAILLGLILASDELAQSANEHRWRLRAASFCVLLVVLIGYAARIADVPLL
jgi:hypothetical protein